MVEGKKIIYLDWNTLKGIKEPKKEPFISLRKVLEKHNDKLLFPYSPSHLADLNKNYDTNKVFIDSDLKFLQSISNNLLISHFWGDKEITYVEKNVIDYFHEIRESQLEEVPTSQTIDEVFNSIPVVKTLLENFDLKSLLPNLTILENSETGKVLSKQYKTFFESGNLMDLIKDVSSQNETFQSNPNEYNNLTKGIKEDLTLDTNISNWESAIQNLDLYLSESKFGKSFSQLLYETVKVYHKEPTLIDYYLSAYQQLGLFGFRPDKLNHKNTYNNTIDDGNHSLYGIHSSCFITNDKVMFYRTKALKEYFKAETILFNTFKVDDLDAFLNDIENAIK